MEQIEKVQKGLECCVLRDPDDHRRCGECPYNPHAISNAPCANGLMFNALALIRQQQARIAELEAAQTARVMTLEEVQASEDCMEPVFLEMLDENGKSGDTPDIFSWRFVKHITTITGSKIFVLNNTGFSSALYAETYNLSWRCWTSRPTDEQRKAVKWDERDGRRCEEICKHAPPEKKWPCIDCDMSIHDRAEPPKEEEPK